MVFFGDEIGLFFFCMLFHMRQGSFLRQGTALMPKDEAFWRGNMALFGIDGALLRCHQT